MFRQIMLPVDLARLPDLERSITMAGDLARQHHAAITVVGVTGTGPGAVAKTPDGYAEKLDAFAATLAERSGAPVAARAIPDNDVAADLGDVLVAAAADIGADLIVMASHVPGLLDHVFASNAGYVASHARCSVAVVR